MGWRSSAWTEARTERLRVLWFAGWSASECGMQLGCSRNAVIGRVHRLGWHYKERQPRPLASKARHLIIRRPVPEPPPEIPQMRPNKRPSDPLVGNWTLEDLRHGVCKWPDGDRHPFRYCGDKALEGAPYCEAHTRRARQGPQHRARPIESYTIKRLARGG